MTSLAEQKQEVLERTKELRQKIQLTEGEGKAFYEESEAEKQRNRATIAQLRADSRALRVRIHEAKQGEERAVERVLQQERRRYISTGGGRPSPSLLPSARVTSASHAIDQTRYKLHDLAKKLNALKHEKNKCEERLAELQAQLLPSGRTRLQKEQFTIRNLKEEHVALENEQERIKVQVSEALSVKRSYVSMVSALRGEAALHTTSLDALHVRLQEERNALNKLKESRQGAERTRDLLKSRLHEEELTAYEARRERERRITEYRQRAEERRVSQINAGASANAERRLSLLRSPQRRDSELGGDLVVHGDEEEGADLNEELQRHMTLFARVKLILGVDSAEAVIQRVEGQRTTTRQLQQARAAAMAELQAAEQQREALQYSLTKLKYAATEDAARTRVEEERLRSALTAVQCRLASVGSRRVQVAQHLATATAALRHVAEKMESVLPDKAPRHASPVSQSLSLLHYCRAGTAALLQQLQAEQLQERTVLSDEELEQHLSVALDNIRINMPHVAGTEQQQQGSQQDTGDVKAMKAYERIKALFLHMVEEDSGDDETASRRSLKRAAQLIVESKAKKRNRPVTTFKS